MTRSTRRQLAALRLLPKASFETSSGEAVIWCGLGDNGDETAVACEESNGGTTLKQYLDSNGITLPKYTKKDPASVEAWKAASTAFARGTRGDIRVVVGHIVRPGSIWATVERARWRTIRR